MGQYAQMIAAAAKITRGYGERILVGVTAQQFARKATVNGKVIDANHPAWVFGHLATYPTGALLPDDDALAADFVVLRAWRERVTKALEPFRAAKHKSVDATVTLHAPHEDHAVLARHHHELADLFIVSGVDLHATDLAAVEVGEHGGHRCERCWKWFDALAPAPAPADVCARCAQALAALRAS